MIKLYKITYSRIYYVWINGGMTERVNESGLFEFITTDNIIEFMEKFETPIKTSKKEDGEKIETQNSKTITDILFIDSLNK